MTGTPTEAYVTYKSGGDDVTPFVPMTFGQGGTLFLTVSGRYV